ncbi:MAG TPA: hypothetical protein VGZ22_09275 [Isosphaeraceae bacterium]|nr:hypothetical protein [Isosphaeraceae bacterium]
MGRWPLASFLMVGAGVLALGLGIGQSSAQAQVAGGSYYAPRYAAPAPYYGPGYYYPRAYSSSRPVYVNRSLNGYNPGPVGPGPARDWTSGRSVRLAKPWLRPLQP